MKFLYYSIFLLSFFCCKKNEKSSSTPASNSPPKPNPATVEAVIADFQNINQDIKLPGRLLAAEQIDIHPEISSQIKSILFKDAQLVNQNQLLVRLNDDEVLARLNKLKVQEELLKNNEQRQLELYKNKAIGQSEYELSLLQYKNVLSDIKITEAEIKKYYIRAPFSGILGFRNISPGDFINSNTVITTLTQVHPLKLKFSVPEQYSNRLKTSQKISFNCENINQHFEAVIQSMAPFLNEESKSLDILALVQGEDKKLKPGAYASVELNLDSKPNSIFIPSQCIIPTIKDKQVAIYKSGKVQFSTVKLAFRDSARVEIVNGINKGDTIISTGLMRLKQGMSVNISNMKSTK